MRSSWRQVVMERRIEENERKDRRSLGIDVAGSQAIAE